MVPEYFNNTLGTISHIKRTCIPENFESNGALVLCVLFTKESGVFTHQSYRR